MGQFAHGHKESILAFYLYKRQIRKAFHHLVFIGMNEIVQNPVCLIVIPAVVEL